MYTRSRIFAGLTAICALAVPQTQSRAENQTEETPRGVIRSVNRAMISTDLQARAKKITKREGESFKKGDVLVEFDCSKQRAELASAEAQQHEMELTLQNYQVLQRAQAAGRHEIEISKTRVDKATADADALRARITDCTVIAPFDGRILELTLYEYETPPAGRPFIGLIADGAMEVDLIAPSSWTRWLKNGDTFTFAVEETQTYEAAIVTRIGAAVDPVSQTIKVVGVFKNPNQGVLPGMSGTARFDRSGG